MTPANLKCFGVGDGWACPDRYHSAFLYRFGEDSVLIDAGEPVSGSFKASGLSYELIDRILISHLHFDHVGGLFMLLQGFWLQRRKKRLVIQMPEHGIAPVRNMLNAGCIFNELLPFELVFEPLRSGFTWEVGSLRLTAFPTSHLERLRESFQAKYPQPFPAFSFLMESGTMRIGHTADIGAVEDLDPLLAHPLDLLVCELAHVQTEALFRRLEKSKIRRVVFIHLGRPLWNQLTRTKALAAEMLSISHSFARDGEEITIS